MKTSTGARVLLAALATVAAAQMARAALIPPYMIDSVVAIGAMMNTNPPGQTPKLEWVTLGTGFFYGYKVKEDTDPARREYAVYLVTAGHVISEFRANSQASASHVTLAVRINSNDPTEPARTFEMPDHSPDGKGTWFFHPKLNPPAPDNDIAGAQVNADEIKKLGATFLTNDEAAADTRKLNNIGTAAGDGVFVLGFPMNLAGEQRNYVIVRQGIIARIAELLDKTSGTFLLDSFVFPGNSGSPVILKPEITSIQGTAANGRALLIGVVIDYKPYTDVAISQQTHRARIAFEENSGLADVIPLDRVDEAIAAYRSRQE
jgi:S1-C subfamily serine protease